MKNLIIVTRGLRYNLIFLLLFPLFSSCSCSNIGLQVDTIISGQSFNGLWLISSNKNVYAIDPDTLNVKSHFALNTFVSQPVLANDGNLLLGDQGETIGSFGNGLYVLSPRGEVVKNIPVLPNISSIVQAGAFIFTDSMCIYEDGYFGYSLIDVNNKYSFTYSMTLSSFVAHSGSQWIYNNILYVGTAADAIQGRPASFVTIDCESGIPSDVMNDFTLAIEDNRQFFYTLEGSSLYTLYGYEKIVQRFDLDSRNLVASSDLKDCLSQAIPDLGLTVMQYPVAFNKELYVLCSAIHGNPDLSFQGLIILDLESLVIQNILPLEYVTTSVLLPPFYFFNEYPDFVYFRYYNLLLKYDLTTGKVVKHVSL